MALFVGAGAQAAGPAAPCLGAAALALGGAVSAARLMSATRLGAQGGSVLGASRGSLGMAPWEDRGLASPVPSALEPPGVV